MLGSRNTSHGVVVACRALVLRLPFLSSLVCLLAVACSGTDATAFGDGGTSPGTSTASGTTALGDACRTTAECVTGGHCGKDKRGTVRCLKICTDDDQCGGTRDCDTVDEATRTRACTDDDFYD